MIPEWWAPPCESQCTRKYITFTQFPWRVFCKKGCSSDGDTWEDCVGDCNEICYKDPVLKDQQWSAYIDRSPGADRSSEKCFQACVSGCGFKFDIPSEKVSKVQPNRPPPPPKPPAKPELPPAVGKAAASPESNPAADDVPSTSA